MQHHLQLPNAPDAPLVAPAMDPPSSHPAIGAEVRSERTAWWIAGSLGVIILLLGLLVFLFWQRTSSPSRGASSNLALVRIADEASDEATVGGWKQRALAAEAMAGNTTASPRSDSLG